MDRCRRYVPCGRHRPAQGMGRPRGRHDDPAGDGLGPGVGGVRHSDLSQGQWSRCGADRHGGSAPQQSGADERTDEDTQRHGQGHPGSAARGDAGA